MFKNPPIFKAEKEAGLSKLIQDNLSLSYLTKLEPSEKFEVDQKKLKFGDHLKAGQESLDLFYGKSLLVTTCWNENDDVFVPEEVWVSRESAKDKPFNYEHTCDDIIGHMTSSYAVDDDLKLLSSDLAVDELPVKFHILNSYVLYKFWAKEDKQERMDKILEDIPEGKYFVSVEALFPTFDYALKDSTGNFKLVARNDKTSFLTKYLRIYGGKGVYDDYRVGRVPRNIIFSGKGLVKNPANPESVIFAKKHSFNNKNLEVVYDLSVNKVKTEVNNMDEKVLVELQAELKKKDEAIEKLQASIRENDVKGLKSEIDSLKAFKVEADKNCEALKTEVATLKAGLEDKTKLHDEVSKQLETVTKSETELKTKLEKIESEKRYADRVTLVKAKLGISEDEKAQKFVDNLKSLSDEAFTGHVEFQAGLVNLSAKKEEVKVETKALDKVEKKEGEVALAATTPTEGVEEIRKGITALAGHYIKTNAGKKFQ